MFVLLINNIEIYQEEYSYSTAIYRLETLKTMDKTSVQQIYELEVPMHIPAEYSWLNYLMSTRFDIFSCSWITSSTLSLGCMKILLLMTMSSQC